MKVKQLLRLILIVLIVTSCSQQKYISAKLNKEEYHQSENISRLDYWLNKKGDILYLVTNDSDNLYIHLKTMDNIAQKKILNYGFTVWVDITGKNKKQLGAKFPLAKSDRMPPMQIGDFQTIEKGNGFQKDNLQFQYQTFEIELFGFNGASESDYILAMNDNDINGKMHFSKEGELNYLLAIPYRRLGLDIEKEPIISIILESGSLDITSANSSQQGGGGKMHGKMGGGSSQRMNGGGQGGRQAGGGNPEMKQQRMEERQKLSTPIKIKISKIKLLNNSM